MTAILPLHVLKRDAVPLHATFASCQALEQSAETPNYRGDAALTQSRLPVIQAGRDRSWRVLKAVTQKWLSEPHGVFANEPCSTHTQLWCFALQRHARRRVLKGQEVPRPGSSASARARPQQLQP